MGSLLNAGACGEEVTKKINEYSKSLHFVAFELCCSAVDAWLLCYKGQGNPCFIGFVCFYIVKRGEGPGPQPPNPTIMVLVSNILKDVRFTYHQNRS